MDWSIRFVMYSMKPRLSESVILETVIVMGSLRLKGGNTPPLKQTAFSHMILVQKTRKITRTLTFNS